MATVNILPNANVSNSPAWGLSPGLTVYESLDDDHTAFPPLDVSMIRTTSAGKICIVGFEDFGETHTSIDSVQAVIKHNVVDRGKSYEIEMRILDSSSSELWAAESTGTVPSSGSWLTTTFTSRTTSNGSDAWVDGDIDGIRMEIKAAALTGGTLRVTYAYFIITYTLTVAADNAVFFGANF